MPDPRRSFVDLVKRHPYASAFTVVVILAVLGWGILQGIGGDEEAPIRVKNGSLDLTIQDSAQAWEALGGSGNWQIKNKKRPKNLFDVTITPATGKTCSGSLTATEPVIKLTYYDTADRVIMLESPANHIKVQPASGVTLSSPSANLLTYSGTGYLKEISAGKNPGQLSVLCTFANKDELDHITIDNPS
jgi:hypothetical protein